MVASRLKQISTFINEEEYKTWRRIREQKNTNDYQLMKKIVKKFLKDQKAVATCIFFWLFVYSLASATYILV